MNLLLCLIGACRHLDRRVAGRRSARHHRHAAAITFGLPPVGALIMLAGIYYGAQYGGSTTSILINIPGEASSVITTLDGSRWQNKAALPGLAIAAIGSFFAAAYRPCWSLRWVRR